MKNMAPRIRLHYFSVLVQSLWLFLSCLLLACAGCQSRGHEASADSLTAPISKPTPVAVAAAPTPAIDPHVTDLERVKEGTPAPDFALENVDRKIYRLSDYRGKKNVVLVFYRGYF